MIKLFVKVFIFCSVSTKFPQWCLCGIGKQGDARVLQQRVFPSPACVLVVAFIYWIIPINVFLCDTQMCRKG